MKTTKKAENWVKEYKNSFCSSVKTFYDKCSSEKVELENIKKEFNKYNFSLVFSVADNRTNVTITDTQEKKPYCGISSRNIDDVEDFLRKNLEKIKKIA